MRVSLDMCWLQNAYARGALSPVDVVNAIHDEIETQGERPVWITLAPRSTALAKAKSAAKGPLYGIPFAVKDNIDVAGLPTTCACPDFSYTPDKSAFVVERLEAAGAILIGKTNLDQFATGLAGTRSPYGIPRNTFNPEYISGGSSSGSAVAVASGLVSFALGTDTAGSGRVPAAFNNIVGLKPTKGLISTRGVVPACRTQDCVSIFALTTHDAAAVLAVAQGYDQAEAYSRKAPQPVVPHALPQQFRVGVPNQSLEFFGDKEAERLYLSAITSAAQLGGQIVEIDFAPFQEAAKLLYNGPWVAERLAAIKSFATSKPGSMHDAVRSIILGAETSKTSCAFQSFYDLAGLIRQAEAEWQKIDTLLLPTAPAIYRVDELLADPIRLNSNLGLYTNFVNLMDLCAIAIPAGMRDNGLPFGVTIISPAFHDGEMVTLADLMHRALPSATLGATQTRLDKTPALETASAPEIIEVAVVGAHLSGQPLNSQLVERGARLIRTTRTSKGYSFYALAGTVPAKPGLVFDGKGAGGIEVEIWSMDASAFGSFVALIPAPLGIGTVTLEGGTAVKGFLCEAHAVTGAENITVTGGWRAWLACGQHIHERAHMGAPQ